MGRLAHAAALLVLSADVSPKADGGGIPARERARWEAVASGYMHSCALSLRGSVTCWGSNQYGALGSADDDAGGPGGKHLAVVELGTGRSVRSLSAGLDHNCAVLDNGAVKCWGANGSGQLGLGDRVDRSLAEGSMGDGLPSVELGAERTAVRVSAGGHHSCAILDDGAVKCWGDNTYGQLGSFDGRTGRSAHAVAAGLSHTCVLLDDGAVECWGSNTYGQLGLGERPLQKGRRAVDIASNAGAMHTCALLEDGAVECWGYDGYGQIDVPFDLRRAAIAIAVNANASCAVLDDGTVRCWGYEAADAPANVRGELRSISGGCYHTCVIDADLQPKCWGYNGSGQLP